MVYQEKIDMYSNYFKKIDYKSFPSTIPKPSGVISNPLAPNLTPTPTKIFIPIDNLGTPGPRQREEGLPAPDQTTPIRSQQLIP